MKKLILYILLTFPFFANGQVDTVIDCGFYKSYFNYKFSQPLYVSYKLYKGGGDCLRDKFRFKNDTQIKMASPSDYEKSGFEMGHLANSEDFAYDCPMDEKTFRMYNCLPQYPNLNRGSWKKWETRIRKLSQTDSLLIICGGTFSDRKIKENSKISVPDYCWKLVKSLTTKEILYVLWFTNEKKSNESQISLELLKKNCNYTIDIK